MHRIVKYVCLLLTQLIQDFIPCLKDFALCKILGQEYDFDKVSFTEVECASITFIKNKIYQHKVMQVNYTTYDMRREQQEVCTSKCQHAMLGEGGGVRPVLKHIFLK